MIIHKEVKKWKVPPYEKVEVQQIITLGETVCRKLRNIYYREIPWIECHKLVAEKYSYLKKQAFKFYGDKDELDVCKELAKYLPAEIEELINHEFHVERKELK